MTRPARPIAPPPARYDAFISYSHGADNRVADALQDLLQRLAKPWYRPRALRVYRDVTDLTATPEAWRTIEAALDASRYFLLLASTTAAASKWVRREVGHWVAEGRASRLLIALTEGEIAWK